MYIRGCFGEHEAMVKHITLFVLIVAAFTCSLRGESYWIDPYDVVWTTPSKDAAGSMPLGNGEVGINLWVEENGDLNFYISRSDSFSEISRLLKVGQVRVAITPNPFVTGAKFEQRLHLHDGVCEITAGEGMNKVTLKVFVDADQPVVHVTGESASPVAVKASAIIWRSAKRIIPKAEQGSAWTMRDAPMELTESADVSIAAGPDVLWYHRNEQSCVGSTIDVQSLGSIKKTITDPLLHRTFGGLLCGAGFVPSGSDAIQTSKSEKSFALRAVALCEQTASVDEWKQDSLAIASKSEADSYERTLNGWHQFWDRSYIITNGGSSIIVPSNKHPLRIGFDSDHQNKFPGEIARAAIHNRALSADDIAALAATPHNQPSPVVADATPDFSGAFTLEAWIKPDALSPGRIFDKLTAGHSDGFLFDTYPGDTLRLIAGDAKLDGKPGILTAGQWHHAAATIDPASGSLRLFLDGKVVAETVPDGVSPITRAYTLQRYVQACGGRGNYPIKFNGGIFTVEPRAMGLPFNADYRAWGDCFWWQNTRHMYHPMLASGDFEMMDPLFKMYESVRPLCEARAELYHHCKGCYFPETMTIWGTYSNGDYGWKREGHKPEDVLCPYWQYAWNQGPELVGLLLDRWDYTQDPAFLNKYVLPMATPVLEYFDTRFKKDPSGKIILDPDQSIETFWHGVINDLPTTAGLIDITTRLCALPENLTTPEQRRFFAHMKAACPTVPIEEKIFNGKAVRLLAPAQKYVDKRNNCENPELYAVWPFRLYGIGKPGLDLALAAYAHRANTLDVGWGPDGNCAALLGLADESARILNKKCANSHAGYRWPATWGPNFDWLPDQNHGGNLLETTQLMLLQCDDKKIRLLPAWPKNWDVSFKLHATRNTVVECVYRAGKIQKLQVTPENRRADVLLPGA